MKKKAEGKPISPLEESYKHIAPPNNLPPEEKEAWENFISVLKNGTRYKKSLADAELVRRRVQALVGGRFRRAGVRYSSDSGEPTGG